MTREWLARGKSRFGPGSLRRVRLPVVGRWKEPAMGRLGDKSEGTALMEAPRWTDLQSSRCAKKASMIGITCLGGEW